MSQNLGYHVSDYVIGKDDMFLYGMKNLYIILVAIYSIGATFTAFRFFNTKFRNEYNLKLN